MGKRNFFLALYTYSHLQLYLFRERHTRQTWGKKKGKKKEGQRGGGRVNKKFLSWLPPPPPPLLPNDFPSFLSRVLNSPESDAQYTYDFLTIAIFIVLFGGNLVAVQVPLLRTIFPANNAYVAFQEEGFPFRFHDTLYFVNTSCCGVFFRLYCSFTLCAVLSNHSGSSVARKNFFAMVSHTTERRSHLCFPVGSLFFLSLSLSFTRGQLCIPFLMFPFFCLTLYISSGEGGAISCMEGAAGDEFDR